MGYNKEDYVRIKAEYSQKYVKARQMADERRFELYAKIPKVRQIDSILAGTGSEIMAIIVSGKSDTDEKIAALKSRNDELLAQKGFYASLYNAQYK